LRMRRILIEAAVFFIAFLSVAAGKPPRAPKSPAPPPSDAFVDIQTVAPGIRLDLRYATPNNFTKQTVYPVAKCLLRRAVAERLAKVQAELEAEGHGLKLFDCYRPLSVQRKFWELVKDERYVANPLKGSRHNRGAAVDLTIVTRAGEEVDMGSDFDDFSPRAHRNNSDIPQAVRDNRARLDRAMERHGFTGMPTEWWHFDGADWRRYPVSDEPLR
jgi:zinc D-Ala-D-Ala dipeptidase